MAETYNAKKKIHRIPTRLAEAHGVEWELLQTCLGFAFTVQEEGRKSRSSEEKLTDAVADGGHPSLERIARSARNLTGATGAALALGSMEAMVCVARSGQSAPSVGTHFNASSGLGGECARTGEPAVCVNAAADPRVNYQACRALNIASMLYFPLRSPQGKVIGMLGVFSSRPRHFSSRDIACLRFTEGLVQEAVGRSAASADPATLAVLLRQADFPQVDSVQINDEPEGDSAPSTTFPPAAGSKPTFAPTEREGSAPIPFAPRIPRAAGASSVASAPISMRTRTIETAGDQRAEAAAMDALGPQPGAGLAQLNPRHNPQPNPQSNPQRNAQLNRGSNALACPQPAEQAMVLPDFRTQAQPNPQAEVKPKSEPIFVGRVVDESVQDSEPDLSFLAETTDEPARRSRIPAILVLLVAALITFAALNYDRFFGRAREETKPPAPKAESNLLSPVPTETPAGDTPNVPERELTQGVSLRSADGNATVTILLPKAVAYQGYQLHHPDRVYFDLHNTRLADAKGNSFRSERGLISQVRLADYGPGTTRVVFDLRQPATFAARVADNPQRLVIDLHRAGEAGTPDNATTVPTRVTIVVDPGHGGKDLGTVSPGGLREKDLTLDVALRLGALLRGKLGANVIFTRSGDEFVPLEERAAIANQAHADFLISIHGNSSTVQSVRGVETYYLREAGTPESAAGAATAQAFAADVHRALLTGLADARQPMRDRGVKQASFEVLRDARMPAALAEISFVSNRNDAPRLESEEYRQQIAHALYLGIANHLNHQTSHAAHPNSRLASTANLLPEPATPPVTP